MATPSKKILIVEDEAIAAFYLKELLVKKGYEVVGVESSAEEAIVRIEDLSPDLVLMDIFLQGSMDGIEASKHIYGKFNIPVIFLTAYSHDSLVQSATQTGPFGYLIKPYNESELYANIEIALLKHRSATYLKELNETRDKFFSVIAHDLRNPLAALFQTTGVLKDRMATLSPDEISFFLNEINSTSHTLYKLTENLLEWARIQSNRIEFKPVRFKISVPVEYALNIAQNGAKQKGILIRNLTREDQYAWGDVDMVVSVINNLLSNAIKFSHPDSEIVISSRERGNFVEVTVLDKGVGIDQKHIDQLFTSRYKSLGTREEKGTGLGLILTKEFVEKNGGTISVSSAVGKGTSVTFTLPLNSPK